MKKDLVKTEYQGINLHFSEDAWFNATEAADKFGKRVDNWFRLEETQQYIALLKESSNLHPSDVRYVKTSKARKDRGGGTWLHPKLAVVFARWLDIRFAIWCDSQIDQLIRGTHEHYNWKQARVEAAAGYNVMLETLKMSRELEGKSTKKHHYINESRLINHALVSAFDHSNREDLNELELKLLTKLEIRDTMLIARGESYQDRKAALELFVMDWLQAQNTIDDKAA